MSTEGSGEGFARVTFPKGVSLKLEGRRLTARGPLGTVVRTFPAAALELRTEGTEAILALRIPANRKRARSLLRTWAAHLANLAGGLTNGVEARMKVVAAHFPMKVQARESQLVIENFLGEKHPRSALLVPGVQAKVDGDFVVLTGHDIEEVGQTSANIERATRIRDYDPRVFQDGIYVIERAHVREAPP